MKVVFAGDAMIGGKKCYFGSVVSYAMSKNAENPNYPQFQCDPIAAIERAKSKGTSCTGSAGTSVICGDAGFYEREEAAKWVDAPVLAVGDRVMFEGIAFEIQPDHNSNFKLVPVS